MPTNPAPPPYSHPGGPPRPVQPPAPGSILNRAFLPAFPLCAAIREGHLTLFKYLPLCMPDDFVQHLPQVGSQLPAPVARLCCS